AWEDMFESGRHVFWRNNEIAGEAAVLHAYNLYGKLPYETKVAILGRGNIGRGAYKTLVALGADVVMYDRRTEVLFQEELGKYDVLVNA
ncbi:N(5)-(carboxyethyl)ornithine synthase, partial [Bacillus thuringiensis]|nr:N(5)-(carboxyethyl)ornithine synthase [Bacillus thuringiensis]